MEAQLEVMEQLENLAVGPGELRRADQEEMSGPTESGGEVQAPLPPAAGMEAQREVMEQPEVMEQLENLAAGPGGQLSVAQEKVSGPAEGGGEAQDPLPPAAGSRRSPPPAWPGAPAAAVPSSASDSDTDSDSSSTTLFSSSSAVSDEDEYPNEKDNRSYCVRTKDEVPIDKLPPVEDLSIILPDNVELKIFGTVSSIIEQLVIIESLRGLPPVNEESIIFKEDRQAAGKIFEIFGPVSHPFYVMRFNSSEHIKEKGINVQDSMYFAPSVEDFTQYIFAEKLKQEKGSDASWKNDQEPPPDVLDFSDDEKEREAKQKKKKPQSQGRKKVRSEKLPSNCFSSLQHGASPIEFLRLTPVRIKNFISQCNSLLQVIQGDAVAEGSPGIYFLLHQVLKGFSDQDKEEETVNIALLDALGCPWLAVCPCDRHHQPRDPKGQLKNYIRNRREYHVEAKDRCFCHGLRIPEIVFTEWIRSVIYALQSSVSSADFLTFDVCPFDSFIYVINEDVKYDCSQSGPLRDITCHWCPMRPDI
ncbi:hypothetical protein DUI87_08925 [Hirundo rustica rustica]|uniref:H/ACA ribonucleoprotein complex non-core subunit NAF1 n=1 Tax=Hirundo rustica rustica TaxID=333673 RepID=A0A3M0KKS3_HIRRU|nr:hypothetical protein DUI87_08925 [Hirundo rustica rustica]